MGFVFCCCCTLFFCAKNRKRIIIFVFKCNLKQKNFIKRYEKNWTQCAAYLHKHTHVIIHFSRYIALIYNCVYRLFFISYINIWINLKCVPFLRSCFGSSFSLPLQCVKEKKLFLINFIFIYYFYIVLYSASLYSL